MNTENTFLSEQLSFVRVKSAFTRYQSDLIQRLGKKEVTWNKVEVALIALKRDSVLTVYVKNIADSSFQEFITYPFCVLSGSLGPKRKEGDLQVPEGFYSIDKFNPKSNFHLSMRINYPNESDLHFADKNEPGSEIYIHGACKSVGCIPITDERIEELYVLCAQARANGQMRIPVYIFPFEMTSENLAESFKQHGATDTLVKFWNNLQQGYQQWKSTMNVLNFKVDSIGQYVFLP